MGEASDRGLQFARRVYRLRTVGLALGSLCVAAVFRQHGATPLAWAALAANAFVWPHIAWLAARRSAEPRRAEGRNLVADSALGGLWIALMGFNPLPSVLLASMLTMDKYAAGGAKLLARGVAAMLAAAAAAALLSGPQWYPETTPLIVAGCVPLLVFYPLTVGITLRRLARRLGERTHELERQIEEHLRTQASLAEAKEQAERANRGKSEFLTRIGHGLRTPLNSVLGFSELLKMEAGTALSAEQRDWVDMIAGSGQQLLRLIEDALDIARIESGRIVPVIEEIDPCEVIAECLALSREAAEARRVALHADCVRGATASADRARVKRALLNLVSNAVKFSAEGGEVRVAAAPHGDGYLRISVSDTGPGVAEDRRADLFEPFGKLNADRVATEGAGVGLALAKRLIEAMRGRIGYESEQGLGTTFWIDLPLATEDAQGATSRGA